MEDQLCLWPKAEEPYQKPSIWEDLSPETQRTIISVLAKLIGQATCPRPQEEKNEL